MSLNIKYKKLPIVSNDQWLEPVAKEVFERYATYIHKLNSIENDYKSLLKFADAYKYFGFNLNRKTNTWVFREWAPKANALFLTGDFNNWNDSSHPLNKDKYGNWTIELNATEYKNKLTHGSNYKLIIHSQKGVHWRIPAYANKLVQDDTTKDFTAQFWNPGKYNWEGDKLDLSKNKSLLIYECHIGMAQEKKDVGTYREFTKNILPHVKKSGYNVIQFMAIAEHPYYGSFGYHVSNFFAPSSRFGTPEDLKDLIKEAHKLGIAVVMDIVHSHTVKNINEGLNQLDGSDDQYFHPGERGEHPSWDSKLFDYGKIEVIRFLLSNIKYWMREFHFDGFRFDGVGSMLYWHHGYDIPFNLDKYFTQGVEFDAITYLQLANSLIHKINPKAISIAEDVSGMPGLCNKISDGGIGFDFRLGMGIPDYWIKILKDQADENWNIEEMYSTIIDRKWDVKTIAYAESHDQALVGDKTIAFRLMDKEMYFNMQVDNKNHIVDRGIALHKIIRLFTISLGGEAYLNFMGNEFGHPEWIDFPREDNNWSYDHARRQWSLANNKQLKYQYLEKWDIAMVNIIDHFNILSANHPALLNMDHLNKTVIFERGGLIFVFNFHPTNSVPDYEFTVHNPGKYKLILNSDSPEFNGHYRINDDSNFMTNKNKDTGQHSLKIYNINRAALIFKKVD